MPKVYYIGDSTVQTNVHLKFPQTGIGQVLPIFLKPEYQVINLAKNGRSTKSFIDESRFKPVQAGIGKGDFLFIQFGHNDEKKEDSLRYTDPQTSFRDNLKFFTDTARAVSAYPVIMTPIERRLFDDTGKLKPSAHTPYVEAELDFGGKENVPVIDLCKRSRDLLTRLGDEASKALYMNFREGLYLTHPEGKADNTHLRYYGAFTYAGMIAEGLKELGKPYEDMILTEIPEDDVFAKNGY